MKDAENPMNKLGTNWVKDTSSSDENYPFDVKVGPHGPVVSLREPYTTKIREIGKRLIEIEMRSPGIIRMRGAIDPSVYSPVMTELEEIGLKKRFLKSQLQFIYDTVLSRQDAAQICLMHSLLIGPENSKGRNECWTGFGTYVGSCGFLCFNELFKRNTGGANGTLLLLFVRNCFEEIRDLLDPVQDLSREPSRSAEESKRTALDVLLDDPVFRKQRSMFDSLNAACSSGCDEDQLPNGSGEFAVTPTNPIPTNTIYGSEVYLSQLCTSDGFKVQYSRKGSIPSPVTLMPVDIYELSLTDGKMLGTIYISPYHKRNSSRAPVGFRLIFAGDSSQFPAAKQEQECTTSVHPRDIWSGLTLAVRRERPLLIAWLESAHSFTVSGQELVVYFGNDNLDALKSLSRESNVKTLAALLLKLAPLKISLRELNS